VIPLPTAEILRHFLCPACGASRLAAGEGTIECAECRRTYPVRQGVIDFVLYDRLGATEHGEIRAMTIPPDDTARACRLVEKDTWDRIQTHFLLRGIRVAAGFLAAYPPGRTVLATVGSGAGFELRMLGRFRPLTTVLASDISWSAAALVPESVSTAEGALGLFACDVNLCPLRRDARLILFVFEALHHTDDVHATIDRLLATTCDHLVFVEPTRNWLVSLLARFGLTMRVEYSGLKPDWVDLGRVRAIARRRGFEMRAVTWWPFPDSLVPGFVKRSRLLSALLCAAVDTISALTAPFRFGAMSAVHLWRSDSSRV